MLLELYVVALYINNAFCVTGRIVIYNGLLSDLGSDADLASVIGHEVCLN